MKDVMDEELVRVY